MSEPTTQGEFAPIAPAEAPGATSPAPAAEVAEPVAPIAVTAVRHPSPSRLRVGIVAAGLVAILGGAAITLAANSPATTSSGTTTAANTESGAVLRIGGDFFGGPGGPGFGRHGGFREITITAINGSNLSLATADGWTRTITVDADTTFAKAGETIALADLAVGDQVRFMQTLEDDGSFTIDAVVVVLPHVGGEVTAVSGSTITVEQHDGTSATINVTADTTYVVDGDEDASLSDIEVGDFVIAEGTENSDGSLTASRVGSGRGHFHRGPFGPGGRDSSADESGDTSSEG
ncbi:MAG: DUF5666 domain-containing protein [Chloroflexi bacterium]|nr:DUF5666 domain-containing protein [Chloroflexota bacterium]